MMIWMDNLPKPKEWRIAIEGVWAVVFHLVPQVWAHQDYMLDIMQFFYIFSYDFHVFLMYSHFLWLTS